MKRRRFLKLFGGWAIATLPAARRSAAAPRKVIVAGGGIMGASIAYHLSRRGAEVTLLEKDEPAAGATRNSFAWINAHYSKQPYHYHRLNRLSALAYRHLQIELGGKLPLQWKGALEWYGDAERARQLRIDVKRHQHWGFPAHLVDEAEFHRLEPHIVSGPVLAAAASELDGSIDPVGATQTLLEKAGEAGAHIDYPCEVTGLDIHWGRLRGVVTTKGKREADVLVIACGVDTPRLAAMAGVEVPLQHSPGLLAHMEPKPRLLHGVVVAPGAHMKQKLDGRIVTGAGGGPPEDDTHRHLASGPQDFEDEDTRSLHGERIQQEAARFLPDIEQARVERVTMGWRPLPKDGHPVVGFPEGGGGIYLAVMHSGVTLAPLMGRLATLEILDGVDVELLAPYRAARFASQAAAGAPFVKH